MNVMNVLNMRSIKDARVLGKSVVYGASVPGSSVTILSPVRIEVIRLFHLDVSRVANLPGSC
jgi:hypothetical protein